MRDYELIITHLCVGQGLSVLLNMEYHDAMDNKKYFVGLFDCGSTAGGKDFYDSALESISKAVSNNGGVLNYVHISHFDRDHYNLLFKLGDDYNKRNKKKIHVEKFVFGCTGNKDVGNIKKRLGNSFDITENEIFVLNEFGARVVGGRIYEVPPDENFRKICHQIELGNDLFFSIIPILYHGQLFPERREELKCIKLGKKDVYVNTGSSLIKVSIFGKYGTCILPTASYFFTGDITVEAMKILKFKSNLMFSSEQKVLQIAHHGAIKHVADCEETNDFTTLKWFLELIKPFAAVVSAKCINKKGWSHPNWSTMAVYEEAVRPCVSQDRIITSFMERGNQRVVRQKTTKKELYETFKLDDSAVSDGAIYKNCSQKQYLLYDIRTVISSAAAYILVEEVARQ